MTRIAFPLLILLTALCLSGTAQQLSAHRGTVQDSYNFWIYTPTDYDSTGAEKPLLLFLHGASLRSSNMERCLRYGPIDALRRGKEINAVILNPQLPGGSRWNADKLLRLVDWVQQHYAVDTNRLCVLGMSLGAYGTLDFVGTHPQRVAAAMALCGGSGLRDFCGLNSLPLWILHGTADKSVGLSQSKKVIAAMERCGATDRLLFTPLSGMNHSDLARTFYLAAPYDWLFAHSLATPSRPVDRSFSITVSDLRQAYSNLTRRHIPTGPSLATRHPRFHGGSQRPDSLLVSPHATREEAQASNGAKAQSSTAKQYHQVRSGDTLGHIALRYHTTVKRLCLLNNIQETAILRIGQKIRVR